MVSQEIRELLRSLPAVVVVENDRPAFVIMTHEAWRQVTQDQPVRITSTRPGHLTSSGRSPGDHQEMQILERLNKEILSLRNQIQVQEQAAGEGEAPADTPVDGQ
jgi:hypothetical protein